MLLFLQIERKVQICMKKSLAICFSVLMLVATSCLDGVEEVTLSPYAVLKSFSIGDITSEYPAFTSEGLDTTETKTVLGSSYVFSINQQTGEVFNADSLPYGTEVDSVMINMQLSGYAQIYVDSTDSYEGFLTTDLIDFTTPRKFRITSADSEYHRDYTVSVNVHQVEPEMMKWSDEYLSDNVLVPLRALEFDGKMCLFGKKDTELLLATTVMFGAPSWVCEAITGLPETVDFSTVHCFSGALYVVAGDGLYTSLDGKVWSLCYGGSGLIAIVGASDDEGRMWVASDSGLLTTVDGVSFESAGEVPAGFPLYGVSTASYAMTHNRNIVRYVVVGYSDKEKSGKATVWSKLSTEAVWVRYENENNVYSCPSLKDLTVFRYDGFLYAVGGAGVAQGEDVDAFDSFYISRDNGITWKAPKGFYQRIPSSLKGCDEPFVVTAGSDNVVWIICAGEQLAVRKGMINRLGFKK